MKTLLWAVCFVCLVSCRSVKYVPVETIKTDSIYVNKIQRDSIHRLDSIFVLVKGDTVRVEKYKYLYRDRLVRDTLRVVERDTIREPYPVEKQLTRWQQCGGYPCLAGIRHLPPCPEIKKIAPRGRSIKKPPTFQKLLLHNKA